MRAPGRSISLGLVTLLILLASSFIAYLWIGQQKAVRTDLTYSAAKAAFHRGNHAEALSICRELLTKQRDSPKLLLMAGESASRLKQYDEAIELYDRIPDSAGSDAAIARWAAGEVALQMGQMSVSMQRMEQSLALDAGMDQARDRLIYLFNLSGRRWDAFPHLFAMVQQNRWSVQHLLYLGNIAMPVENEKELKGFLTASPHDRMPLLGLARI
ncbi:MAG: tetratricopeptide repeat protein, partial [Pirellula sp.]